MEWAWKRLDSKRELEQQVETLSGVRSVGLIETEDARQWGLLWIGSSTPIAIKIGYADLGLEPQALFLTDFGLIAINELVAGVDLIDGFIRFVYRMPSIFHEFLRYSDNMVMIRDEIGFVQLDLEGRELWKVCVGIMADFTVMEDLIVGKTIEGKEFRVHLPGS